MPSYSVSASEIKYASGSSWTSGKARQGVYSSTRYEGALNFSGLASEQQLRTRQLERIRLWKIPGNNHNQWCKRCVWFDD